MGNTFRCAGWLLGIICLLSSNAFPAAVLLPTSIDSLLHTNTVVARAQIGRGVPWQTRDGDCIVYEVRVFEVYKGDATPGGKYKVAGIDQYPILPGDIVYLFASPRSSRISYAKYCLTDADWIIPELSLRRESIGGVHGFRQDFGNFGNSRIVAKDDQWTHKQFKQRIQNGLQWAARIVPVIDAPTDPARRNEYLTLLRERNRDLQKEIEVEYWIHADLAARLGYVSDCLMGELAVHAAKVSTPDQLDHLRNDPDLPAEARGVFARSLQRPDGRQYLLTRLAQQNLPPATRLEYAKLLDGIGWSNFRETRDRKSPDDAHFAESLAKLTAAELDPDVLLCLLDTLKDCGRYDSKPGSTPDLLAPDLKAAALTLETLVNDLQGKDLFRLADTIRELDQATYDRVFPNAGPILSLIQPWYDWDAGLKRNEFRVAASFVNTLPKSAPACTEAIVLRNLHTGHETELAVKRRISDVRETSGSSWPYTAPIPAKIQPGRYLLSLRIRQNDQVVSQSIGFETDLPPTP